MNRKGTQNYEVWRKRQGSLEKIVDRVVTEEPLEIRLGIPSGENFIATSVAVTMRTPGADKFLAAGFLFSEGILKSVEQVEKIEFPTTREAQAKGNLIQFNLKKGVDIDFKKVQRNFYTTSSCGVCGKASIEAVMSLADFEKADFEKKITKKLSANLLLSLPEKLFQKQSMFQETGGIHAAALFDFEGDLLEIQEDVGRHNALDKLVGTAFLKNELPLSDKILLVSGRLGFELVQKAAAAEISIIAAVGAPTSLAIDLASAAGITVVGFLKNKKFNVYSHEKLIEGI